MCTFSVHIYTGKQSQSKTIPLDLMLRSHFGVKGLTIVELPSFHLIHFENFFRSQSLLTKFATLEIYASRTIMNNKIEKYSLRPVKKVNEKREEHIIFNKNIEICTVC